MCNATGDHFRELLYACGDAGFSLKYTIREILNDIEYIVKNYWPTDQLVEWEYIKKK